MNLNRKTKALIISHGFRLASGGPAQDIRDYLKDKIDYLDYIDFPFPHADYKQTHFFIFRDQKLIKIKQSWITLGPEWLRYIQQFLILNLYLIFNQSRYDICFALDNHSVLSTFIWRRIGMIKKLIYYSIDYTPIRFQNRFMNFCYHLADKIACKVSDVNWVVAKHMIQARSDNGINIEKTSVFREVPMGFHSNEIQVIRFKQINYRLVYMGTILEKQGVQLAIEALPKLLKIMPKLHLIIIGTGEYESELKRLTKKLNLARFVTFKGFIGDRKEMQKILLNSAVGIAPYKPIPNSFSYYADPSKIKIYLGCGLPVVTTNVTAFSKTIEKYKAGIITEYSTDSFKKTIIKLLKNKERYLKYRCQAIKLASQFDTNTILKKAIDAL